MRIVRKAQTELDIISGGLTKEVTTLKKQIDKLEKDLKAELAKQKRLLDED
jgi:hypothetical protein